MRLRLIVCSALAVMAAMPFAAQAGVIRVESSTIGISGQSTLEVYISGSTTEDLLDFGFEMTITPDGGNLTGSEVSFLADTSYANDTDYVFNGQGNPIQTPDALGTTIHIMDSATTNSVPLTSEFLIARVGLQHTLFGNPADASSDTFTVSFSNTGDASHTWFWDQNYDDLTMTSFTSNSVTVTTQAVPEPGSFTLLGIGGAVLLAARCRRRKHAVTLERNEVRG